MRQPFPDTQIEMLHDMILITRAFQTMSPPTSWNPPGKTQRSPWDPGAPAGAPLAAMAWSSCSDERQAGKRMLEAPRSHESR